MRTSLLLVTGVLAATAAAQAVPPRLTLVQAEALAVANHPQLRAAQLGAQALQQETREVSSAYYPMATGNLTGAEAENGSRIGAGLLNNPSVYSRYANGVSVSQLISDFGRTGNLVASAKLQAAAGASNTEATRADVLVTAAGAFFTALRAQALLVVANQTVANRQVVSQQVMALEQAQLRTTLDVSIANYDLAQARLQQAQAQSDVAAAQAQLGDALGLPAPVTSALEEPPLPAAPADDVQPLLDEAIAQRPELAQLRYQAEAEGKFAAAEADLTRPTLSAAGAAGLIPLGEAPLTSRYAAAGVNLSIPLFNGGDFAARHQAAELRAQAASQELTAEQQAILRDVRVAWLRARTAFSTLDLTQQLLDQAQQAVNLAGSRYNFGLGSIVEVSMSQLNLTQAQIEHAAAIYDFQAAMAGLEYQTGTLH